MDYPIFEVQATTDNELTAVALVDAPAIERTWVKFDQHKKVKLATNDRQIVTGALLIPDQLIYRNQDGMQFYLKYTKESIEQLHLNFMKNNRNTEINLMHIENDKPAGVFIYEIFQSDAERGIKAPDGFEDLPDGTLYASAKVDNPETWTAIKQGEFTGFSIEAWVSPVQIQQSQDEDLIAKFCQLVQEIVNQ